MGIASLITATLVLSSVQPSRPGFETPLVLAHHTVGLARPGLVSTYTTLQAAEADGHAPGTAAHEKLTRLFSQNPRPAKVKVGRRLHTYAQVMTFLPNMTTEGAVYTFKIRHAGVDYTVSYTVGASATATTVSTALKAAIDALSIPSLTTSISTATLVCTGATGKHYSYLDLPPWFTILDTSAANSIADDLNAVRAQDRDWYGLTCDAESKGAVAAVAAVVETIKALYVYDTSDTEAADPGDTDDVLSATKAAGYENTYGIFRKNIGRNTATGLLGARLTVPAGSDTWAYKSVRGVEADTTLTDTEENAVRAKNGDVYTVNGGRNITLYGKTGSGEFVDIIRGLHWLHANIIADVFALFLSNEKVPYTNEGITAIQSAIDARLQIAAGNTHKFVVAESIVVNVPRAEDVPDEDKAARVLNSVSFSATLQGAVHAVNITGSLSP